jgi:hypothetical protein
MLLDVHYYGLLNPDMPVRVELAQNRVQPVLTYRLFIFLAAAHDRVYSPPTSCSFLLLIAHTEKASEGIMRSQPDLDRSVIL